MANQLQVQIVNLFVPFFRMEQERRDFMAECWGPSDLLPDFINSSGTPMEFGQRFVYVAASVGRRQYRPYLAEALGYIKSLVVDQERQGEIARILADLEAKPELLRSFSPKGIDLAYVPPPLPEAGTLAEPGLLPPGSWLAYRRNEFFTGREGDLLAVAGALLYQPAGMGVSVTGMGGIGKTQVAVEFAYRYGRFFAGGVYWVSLAQAESVPAEIALLGGEDGMGLYLEAEELTLAEQVARVQQAWQQATPRLLIFDNCEDETVLAQWLPQRGGCRVLVTSRRGEWSPVLGMGQLQLDVLARGESITLLRRFVPGLAEGEGDAIAAEVGDLPLALHLVGSFMAVCVHDKIGAPAAVLAQLRDPALLEGAALTGEVLTASGLTYKPTDRDLHVARAFAMSFRQLNTADEVNQLALALLACAACLAPEEMIPRTLLTEMVERDKNGVQVAVALKRLVGVGLLTQEADGDVWLHRLLTVYAQGVMAAAMEPMREEVEAYIDRKADELNDAGYPAPLLVWQAHLRHVAEQAADRESEQAGGLLNNMGYHLNMIADYERAWGYFERSLEIREKMLGTEHPHTAQSLNNLGELLRVMGDYEGAWPYYARSLEIREKVLGGEHPATAQSLNNLGLLLKMTGDYEGAKGYYKRALAIHEKILGGDHPNTASSLNNLGTLLQAIGDYEGARSCYERALGIREKVLGEEHPHIAQSLNNLGLLLKVTGDYEGARNYYERALTIDEKVLGRDHPDTATDLHNLGALLHRMEDHEKAREYYERALEIREKVLGKEHPATAQSLNNLGALLRATGDYEKAREYYERALEIKEKVLGGDHPDTAVSLNNLGFLLEVMGNHEEARKYYKRALAIDEKILGRDHLDTAIDLINLGRLLGTTGDYGGVREYYERALAIFEQKLGAEHPDTKIVWGIVSRASF